MFLDLQISNPEYRYLTRSFFYKRNIFECSVVDPDPGGFVSFSPIRIRFQSLPYPDPVYFHKNLNKFALHFSKRSKFVDRSC
jgi:hypothetical protein